MLINWLRLWFAKKILVITTGTEISHKIEIEMEMGY